MWIWIEKYEKCSFKAKIILWFFVMSLHIYLTVNLISFINIQIVWSERSWSALLGRLDRRPLAVAGSGPTTTTTTSSTTPKLTTTHFFHQTKRYLCSFASLSVSLPLSLSFPLSLFLFFSLSLSHFLSLTLSLSLWTEYSEEGAPFA